MLQKILVASDTAWHAPQTCRHLLLASPLLSSRGSWPWSSRHLRGTLDVGWKSSVRGFWTCCMHSDSCSSCFTYRLMAVYSMHIMVEPPWAWSRFFQQQLLLLGSTQQSVKSTPCRYAICKLTGTLSPDMQMQILAWACEPSYTHTHTCGRSAVDCTKWQVCSMEYWIN